MAKTGVILIGGEAIERVIDELPKESSKRRVWRRIARRGSRPIISDVRSQVPVKDGYLKKSIIYKNYPNRIYRGMGGWVKPGHFKDSNTMTNPAKASVLVNNRKVKPLNIAYPNWFERAAKRQRSAVLSRMEKDAAKFIDKEIEKLLRK